MRVLVIEDEADLARALYRALEEEGYSVDVARDGVDGLFKAQSCEYDAVVLDLMLPKLDGLSVLRRLRESSKSPVLILTARDAVVDKVRGLDLGADDYQTKPFVLDEFLARVRSLIRRGSREPAPLLTIGDVEIDTTARAVRKAGQPVVLTAKEYALAEFLARHRGQLVTRTMIFEHIYNEDDETLSNVVDVYISILRKRLGKDFVITRRGEGYIVDV